MYDEAYLRLETLVERNPGAKPADVLTAALEATRRGGVLSVTLDLQGTSALVVGAEVESLVAVIRARWPRPAFCVVGEADTSVWSRAAAAQAQPLLHWANAIGRGGYRVLGRSPAGAYASLLRALCSSHLHQATAEQLVRDPTIVSPRRVRFDSYSIRRWEETGRFPMGPNLTDVDRVANDLRNMALQRYIVQISPGIFRAVRPVLPPGAKVLGAQPGEE